MGSASLSTCQQSEAQEFLHAGSTSVENFMLKVEGRQRTAFYLDPGSISCRDSFAGADGVVVRCR